MKRKMDWDAVRNCLYFMAVIVPFIEFVNIGTISGFTVGVWLLLYLEWAVRKSGKPPKKKPRAESESPKLEIIKRGKGWYCERIKSKNHVD